MDSFARPSIFNLIQHVGGVEEPEMRRTFNLGIGMVLAVAPEDVAQTMEILVAAGERPLVIGDVHAGGEGGCELR
jgi:phosphoribosylformylglycinamidine cyclo-ligase